MKEKLLELAIKTAPEGLKEAVKKAMDATFEAAMAIKELYGKPHNIKYKGQIDLVTEADYRSEEILKGALSGVGDAEIMAEESSVGAELKNGRFWIIDPLDGTTNFAHSFPFFAPSVALSTVEDGKYQTQFGCIFIPLLNEFFWAIRNKGAFLNLEKIRVSEEKELRKSLLATGFPYDVYEKPDEVISIFKSMIIRAQGIRRAGAAAIDLAYVACGRFDGFWEMKLKPWDTAAGILLVEEAGGRVSDFNGGIYNPFMKEICASNSSIHNQMLEVLKEYSCQHTSI